MADQVSTGLERVFQAHRLSLEDPTAWDAPKIAIQAGRGWDVAENEIIIEGLSMQARGAIDMIVQHFYPRNMEVIPHFGGPFDRMDDFANAPGFGELDYFVSEWNISSSKSGADAGLQHASALPEIVATFLERGVDEAAIWGTQYLNLHARLSGLTRTDEQASGFSYFLTPGGDMFRWMREDIPGTRLLDVSTPEALRTQLGVPIEERPVDERDQMVMQAFQGPDHTTVYLSSRTDQEMGVTFDPSLIVETYNHLEIQTLTALDDPETTGLDEGDPDTPKARPFISNVSTEDIETTEGFEFTLSPWEIVRMRFTTGEVGVTLSGHDQLVDPAADYGDHLVGGSFDDTLIGYHGDDFLEGETGNDFIDGGDGDDTLDGGYGFDTLLGGPGDDVIRGRRQPDILASGTGVNVLNGGVGPDHFIIDPDSITTVTDIDLRDNETVSFMRLYGTAEEVLTRAATEGGDIVIRHDTGGRTVLSGLAPEFSSLGDILADQISGSPTTEIVNRLLAVPPDGSVATNPDPGTVVDPNAVSGEIQREFERILNSDNPDAFEADIDALTSAEFGQILQEINVNVLFLTAPAPTLVVLGNHMTREQIDAFWASSLPGNASVLVNRLLDESGGVFPASILELAPYPLSVLINNLSADSENRLLASMSQEQINEMEDILSVLQENIIEGTAAGERLIDDTSGAGDSRNDTRILGKEGDDTFVGLSGYDTIDGGDGYDVAEYSGSRDSYTVILSNFGVSISDRRSDGDGTDNLISIEALKFLDIEWQLEKFSGAAELSEHDFESIVEMYIAYFNRAPDAIGLNYWATSFANGMTLEDMAILFVDQDETRETFPLGTTNHEFVKSVYENVLGRAPDAGGLEFWVYHLDHGNISSDQFILEFLEGVPAGTSDRSYLDAKVDIGAYFAVHKGMSDGENATEAMALFENVGVGAAVAAIDDHYTDALDPENGEFLLQVVGVLDDPFGGI